MLRDIIPRPKLCKRYHIRPSQNRYMWYAIVFSSIKFILNRCLRLKPEKGTPNDFFPWNWVNSALAAVQRSNAIHAQRGNSVTCDSLSLMVLTVTKQSTMATILIVQMMRIFGVTLYNSSIYCGLYRTQQFLKDLIETLNNQNRSNHIIELDINFHSKVTKKVEYAQQIFAMSY